MGFFSQLKSTLDTNQTTGKSSGDSLFSNISNATSNISSAKSWIDSKATNSNWYKGDQPTYGEALARAYKIAEEDYDTGLKLVEDLHYLRNDSSSMFYNQYASPTNQAVSNLASLGFDTSLLSEQYIINNWDWVQNNLEYRSGTGNSPSAPTKKSTTNNRIAYELYQYYNSESKTQQVEKEYQDAINEAKYWAGRSDLNYSDQDIVKKVRENFDSKYSNLSKMENPTFAPMELNRGIDWSDDVLYGAIWEARNPEYTGGIEGAVVNSILGTGNQWKDNPETAAKLNRMDTNTYSRYSVGMTLDDEGLYFDVPYFTNEWFEQNKSILDGTDSVAIKNYMSAWNANQTTIKAEEQLDNLNAQIDRWVNSNLSEDRIMKNLDTLLEKSDYSTLRAMDETLETGVGLVKTTRAVPYRRQDIEESIREKVEKRDNKTQKNQTLAKLQIPEMNEYGKTMQARAEAKKTTANTQAPVQTQGQKLTEDIQNQNAATAYNALYDVMTDDERRHFDNQPDVNGAKTADVLCDFKNSKIPNKNLAGPLNPEIVEDPEWGQKFAKEKVNEADDNYSSTAFSSLAFRTTYENVQDQRDALSKQINNINDKYGDLILAHEVIPYEPSVEIDKETGLSINYVLKDDGTYQLDPYYDLDNPAVNEYLVRNGITLDEFQNEINNQKEILDAKAAKIREAKEATKVDDPYGAAMQEKFYESLPDLNVLNAKLAYNDEYLNANQAQYDKDSADVNAANKKREILRNVVLRTGNSVSDTNVQDNLLTYVGGFTNYQSPQAEAETIVGGLESQYANGFTAADAASVQAEINKLQEIIDDTVAVRNLNDVPEEYKQWMSAYTADAEANIRMDKYFLMTKEDGYEDLVEAGKGAYWQNHIDAYESDEVLNETVKTGWSLMSEYEHNLYYAIYAKEGAGAADQFYKDIEDSLIVRSKEGLERNAEARAQTYWGRKLNTILSIGLAAMEVPASLLYLVGSALHGEGDEWLRLPSYASKESYQENIEKIHEIYKGTAWDTIISGMAEMVYNRGRSAVVAAMYGPLFPAGTNEVIQAMPIATIAMADALDEAYEAGAEPWQAWALAATNFLAESFTEGIKLKHMEEAFSMGQISMSKLKDFLISRVPDSISEVIGEDLNNIVERTMNDIVMGDKSDRAKKIQAYVNAGYMPDEAEMMTYVDDFKDDIHTAIVSALSSYFDIGAFAAGKLNSTWQNIKTLDNLRRIGDTTTTLREVSKINAQSIRGIQEQIQELNEESLNRGLKPFYSYETEGRNPASVNESEQNAQQPEYDTDITILANSTNSDKGTVTATLAAVLRTDNMNADQANAAAEALYDIVGEDTIGSLMELWEGGVVSGTNIQALRLSLQYAALVDGKCRAVMTGNAFTQGTPEAKARILSESVMQDINNPNTSAAMEQAVREYRIDAVEHELMTQDEVSEKLEKADSDIALAEKKTRIASDRLENQRGVEAAAADAVAEAGNNVANDPSEDNLKDLDRAREDQKHQAAVTQEYEQSLENAQKDEKSSKDDTARIKEETRAQLRQQAETIVAQQDKQRAEEAMAMAEQQRQYAAEQAEAARQQMIADQRSGKTAEESARAKIQRLAESKGYTGEQAEQFVNDVMNFWKTGQVNKIDLSKQFGKSEGYLMMGALSRRFGVNVDITDIATGENGYYDPNTNTITLNSNLPAGQVLVEFALHELTHSLENTGAYQQYHDTVLNVLFPSEAELNDAIAKKITEYEDAGRPLLTDENGTADEKAKREIVAEFTRLKLNDKAMVQRMVDAGMGGRIRNALHNVNQFLKNIRLTGEARTEAENLRRTERLFQKAIRDRSRAHAKERTEAIKQANTPAAKLERSATPVVSNAQGDAEVSEVRGGTISRTDGDTEYSVASWTDEEKQRVRNQLKDRMMSENDGSMTEEEMDAKIDKWINDVNDIAYIIANDRNRLDYKADPEKTMLKPNAEYVKTLDASTLCAKRLLYQGTFDAIQHLLPNTPLMPEDLIDLANMMREMGYEAPCGICYVESRRRQLGKFTEQWLESYEGEYKPTLDEVTTSDGLERLRSTHPQAYQDFISAMNKKGTMNPKVVQLRTDYRGEISQMTPAQVQKVKDIGGLCVQSFSDFETPHLIDMMQAVMDMSSQKLTAQAYTKVPNFPWVFGDTGIKINLSLIGKGTGLDENGNLLFDDVEGMPFEEAMKLRGRYSNNVGTILVGINDQHILAAMADDRIDFIIPFHKSGWSKEELTKMPVLNGYSDYTDSQNEKAIVGRDKNGKYKTESLDKSKRVNFQPVGENGYWDFSKSGKENAETYLKMCAEDGRLPKFSQFLVDNGDGSFSLQPDGSTDGYWKTLIDFKMYDNEGNGAPQQEVNPNFNMDEAIRVLDEYSLERNGVSRESNNDLPVAQEVVDAYVKKYMDEHPGREYSTGMSEMTKAQMAQALQEANIDYENAVGRGDMEAAQEDVDFYAKQAGYTDRVYHGTDRFGFTIFDMGKSQNEIFVSYNKNVAGTYADAGDWVRKISEKGLDVDFYSMSGQEIVDYLNNLDERTKALFESAGMSFKDASLDDDDWITINIDDDAEMSYEKHDLADQLMSRFSNELGSGVYDLYARPGKQLVIECDGHSWNDIPWALVVDSDPEAQGEHPEMLGVKTRDISKWAREHGYDSVRINGVYDDGGVSYDYGQAYGDIGIFFNQGDIKSADTVTYDNNGNVIPLDQRFSDSNDIRYSVENNQMTDAERNQALIDAGLMTQEELMAQENLPGYPAEGGEAQRQFGYETAQESNALHDEVKQYLYTHSNYMPDTNQGQVNRAIGWVQSKATEIDPDGYYAALDEIASDTFDYRSADGQARMLTVMSMAALKAENGRTAEERRNALNDELRIADAYNKQGTDLGRALQARKIFRLMTPLGRVAALQSMADRINEDYGKKGIKNRVGLSEWTLKAASEAQTEEDFQKVQDAAAKELAEQMPVSWKERLNALRMLSMLGNPRTHIRNIIGNALFVPAVSLKNKLGAVMELGMDKGDRTKTLALAVSKEIRDFARQDAETMKDTLTGTAKYNEDSKVQMERKIFGTGDGILSKTVGNFIQTLSDFNSNALEGEDWFFLKGHYRRALGGWIQANGYTVDEVQSNPDLLEKGRQYAIEEAQKATYRDFNEMAKRLNDATRDAKTVWGKSLAFGVNAVLPFKKTPANILRRGLEYSPLGIAKSLTADAFHLHQYNEYQKGNLEVLPETAISPNQFIDKLCSGLTGSAIMAVGFLLAGCGAVTCGLDDDDDEFEKLKGGQEYSVNFGKLGNMVTEGLFKAKLFGEDVTFTMDWAAPMSMPFFVGAALREQMDGEGVTDIDGVLNAIFSIGEPLTNLSMLDGLNSVFRTSQNSDAITQVGAKIVSNYLTSFIPSAVGAVARSFDPIRRKSFVESGKGSGPAGIFRSSIEQSKNKIPGMSMNSIPVRDAFGNVEETGTVERILENFVLPGYLNSYKNDPVIDELERLYGMVDESKKSGMVPKMPQKTIGNGKVVLSAEQYDQLTEERGKTAHALIEQLMSNRYYQQVSDDDKATMINDVWTYATQNANYSISKDAKVDTWVLNSRANPIQGIVNRQKTRVDTEYKEGYKAAAVESVKNQNWDDLDVCIEKLEEAGVKDPEGSIKTAVGNAFKAQYIRAYQEGDSITMDEIETLLIDSGLGFDSVNKKGQSTFDIWIENMNDQVLSEEEEE